ncbi:uncharacterized protein ACIGJ3_007849 isoform 1-T1 [Trichechus inunguis]
MFTDLRLWLCHTKNTLGVLAASAHLDTPSVSSTMQHYEMKTATLQGHFEEYGIIHIMFVELHLAQIKNIINEEEENDNKESHTVHQQALTFYYCHPTLLLIRRKFEKINICQIHHKCLRCHYPSGKYILGFQIQPKHHLS